MTWETIGAFSLIPLVTLFTEGLLRSYERRLRNKGMVSRDYHKREPRLVPEPAGPAVVIPFISAVLLASALFGDISFLAVAASASLSAIIGIIDDMAPLSALAKPALLMLSPIPLMALGVLIPRPLLPVLGRARLYYMYWLILPIMFSVFSNAINMMDALNGLMPASVIISTLVMIPLLDSRSRWVALFLLASLFPYYVKNRYPATVFGGDTLSLFVGTVIASLASLSNREIFFFMALIPFMVSGFSVIASVKGLRERREMKRPVHVKDGVIYVNLDEDAPMTLISILVSHRGKEEKEIVREVALLTLLSSLLSLATYYLMTPR